MKEREQLIQNYIQAYNNMDLEGMLATLTEDIVFENIQNGEISMKLEGKASFREQALLAISYFSERKQTITHISHLEETSETEIQYWAVLAMDFPNGLKKGQTIELLGKSVFEFKVGRICRLTDISY